MTTIRIPHNWQPRPYQLPLWEYLENGGKRAVGVWHRRSGKDDLCLHWAAVAAMQRVATYWHMLPEASQARKAIWEAVNPHTGKRRIDEAFPQEIRETTREQEMMIRFVNGSTWQVVGSDNYDSLVGSPPAGVVFSEWAIAKPDAWAYLRPILAENGGWALFVYTPRGANHGKKTYDFALTEDGWFAQLLTADDTSVFTAETLAAEKRELVSQYGASRGEALYNQEYFCSWSPAFVGKCIYPEFNRKFHVAEGSLLPAAQSGVKLGRQIVRGWDNTGLSPACLITYVNTLGQWFWLKEFCGKDIGIADFAEQVQLWCAQNFPARTAYRDIGDPAGNIRDTKKGTPKQYIYDATGILIEDGLQSFKIRRESVAGRLTRNIQGEPALLIDPTECPTAINGFLGGYCYPEIGSSGVYKLEPADNDFTHIQDAGQYPATILFPAGIHTEDDSEEGFTGDQGRNATTGY